MQEITHRRCFLFTLVFFLASYTVFQQLFTNDNSTVSDYNLPQSNARFGIIKNDTLSLATTNQDNSTWNVVETATDIDGNLSSAVPDRPGASDSPSTTRGGLKRNRILSTPTKRGGGHGHSDIRRILVVAYKRSGSSFLGEVLSSNPSTFFHFEPLHMVSQLRVASPNLPRALDVITNFFLCTFDKFHDYIVDVKKNMWLLSHNQLLWRLCALRGRVCSHPKYMSRVCRSATTQVMKLVRLHMRDVHEWLKSVDEISGTLKVVHLVRDPRGILASRRAANFSTNWTLDYNAAVLCDEMARDIEALKEIEKDFPGSTVRVRYEDLALDPLKQAELLFAKLGLPFSKTTSEFLRMHTVNGTTKDLANPFSTKRNSNITVFIWKKRLNATDIETIESHCHPVMGELGYNDMVIPEPEK